jgi:hypothetical protein
MRGADFEKVTAGPRHPPGFYGEGGVRRAFNLFKPDAALKPLPTLPAGVEITTFGLRQAVELKYVLMAVAIALALFDLVAGLVLRGLVAPPRLPARQAASVLLATAFAVAMIGDAHAADDYNLKASNTYRLAFVLTGDPEVDAMSRAGLKGLTRILKERTAAEPGEPMAIDIEQDELAFFPLIYWPVSSAQGQLSANALAKVDAFMRNGGTILFDTRDQDSSLPIATGRTANGSLTLRRLLAGLDIPPLQPLAQDHVLTRAFYLLREFPGRWASGRVWVEAQQNAAEGAPSTTASDGVSPIIVGGADWAAAWAEDDSGRRIAAVVPGGERQREMALRFGVNLVMYTLTGNYKADQVHVPAILERLGQ